MRGDPRRGLQTIARALGFGAPDETPPDSVPAPVRLCKDCRYV